MRRQKLRTFERWNKVWESCRSPGVALVLFVFTQHMSSHLRNPHCTTQRTTYQKTTMTYYWKLQSTNASVCNCPYLGVRDEGQQQKEGIKRSNRQIQCHRVFLKLFKLHTFFRHWRPCSSPTPSPTQRKTNDGVSAIAWEQTVRTIFRLGKEKLTGQSEEPTTMQPLKNQ